MNRIRILIIQALNPSYGSGGWAEQAKLVIRVQGGSRTPDDRIVDGLQKAKVLSAIDTLPKIQGAWLRYGYGPQALFDKREIVRHLLARPYKADAAEKWLELADVAVDDARTRITSEGGGIIPPVDIYWMRMGITRQSFAQTWASRRSDMLDMLQGIDTAALSGVAKNMRKTA